MSKQYKRYIAFTLTSQTLVFNDLKIEGKYRYSFMATITDEKAGEYNVTLRNFAAFAKVSLFSILECQINDVTNIEVSKDNISHMYTLRFCSSKDLYRLYTGEITVDENGKVTAKFLSHSDY